MNKFNIGDRVYFIYDNKIQNKPIERILLEVNNKIDYAFVINGNYIRVEELMIFSTKEELLKSL